MTKPAWTTACLDWEDRIREGRSIIPPPIFPEEAEAALAMFKELRIVDAPGSPKIGDACAEWVFDLARSIFGAYDADSGRRLITEWFVLIPKKNSKSSIGAALMLTALARCWRTSAELLILSPTHEVSLNSFAPARDMCQKNEELDALMQVQSHLKTITSRETGASLKVVASDNNSVGGKKSCFVLIDEAWLFGKMANAENMLREATGGLASRPEGFVVWLTTQSDDPPAGVFAQKLKYARDVRDGIVLDPGFVPILYEFPEEMIEKGEHRKVENFGLVNPNLNYSVDRAFLEREFAKAENDGEQSMRGFLAKHLNVEIGLSLRSDRWAGADFWEIADQELNISNVDKTLTLENLLSRCEVAVVGIDGGGLDDLLGLTVLGREKETRKWLLWTHAWAHEIVLKRRKDIAPRLLDFQKDGDLTIVKTPGQDVHELADFVCKVNAAKLMPEKNCIGVDAAGINDIVDELTAPGRDFTLEQIVAISQGWRLNGAIKTTERKLAGNEIIHGGQRLMNWCVGNARTVAQGNAIGITKAVSGSAKIDTLMSAFNCVSLMSLNPEAVAPKHQLFFA